MFPQLECQPHGGTHIISTGVFMSVSQQPVFYRGIYFRGGENYSCTRWVFPIIISIQVSSVYWMIVSAFSFTYICFFHEWHVWRYSYLCYITRWFISPYLDTSNCIRVFVHIKGSRLWTLLHWRIASFPQATSFIGDGDKHEESEIAAQQLFYSCGDAPGLCSCRRPCTWQVLHSRHWYGEI